jgi:Arc/MetJ family transcription regulator
MRTNIDIDDAVLDAAMRAGPFKTKKDAVEAGLKLLSRQAAYREILKWEGKLRWDDHDSGEAATPTSMPTPTTGRAGATRALVAQEPASAKRRHGGR